MFFSSNSCFFLLINVFFLNKVNEASGGELSCLVCGASVAREKNKLETVIGCPEHYNKMNTW